MKNYADLTKRGQVRRLRRLTQNALGKFGFKQYNLKLLQHLDNTTFKLECETGQYLVRVHRVQAHMPHRIESELAWLKALSRDTNIPVQEPHCSSDGKMVVIAEASCVPEPYPITVLSWLNGRILRQERRSPRHFEQLGELVAEIHNHSQSWTRPSCFDRPTYDSDGLFGVWGLFGLDAINANSLPSGVFDDLQTLRGRLQEVEHRLGTNPTVFGMIHFDLSFGNVLFTSNDVMPIDFDNCGFGHYLFDLAVILAGPYERPGFEERCEKLILGYREVRELSDDLLEFIPTFMAVRAALLQQWERVHSMLQLSYPIRTFEIT